MKYFKIDHAAGGFYCRAENEESKNVERRMLDGSWSKLPSAYSIARWRKIGHSISEVSEIESKLVITGDAAPSLKKGDIVQHISSPRSPILVIESCTGNSSINNSIPTPIRHTGGTGRLCTFRPLENGVILAPRYESEMIPVKK